MESSILDKATSAFTDVFSAEAAAAAEHGENSLAVLVENLEHSSLALGLEGLSLIIAIVIGYIGIAVMTYGTLRALLDFIMVTTHGRDRKMPLVRLTLGKHLALGLEFLVGKDIIESIVNPTWAELGKLGVIILLRTLLSIFLSRELKEVEEELRVEKDEISLAERRKKLHKS